MLSAQKLSEFSEVPAEYLKQLEEFMTSSKREVMQKAFDDYEAQFKAGAYGDEEFATILKTSNEMLKNKMKASPYFLDYLKGLDSKIGTMYWMESWQIFKTESLNLLSHFLHFLNTSSPIEP